jgi:N-acetylmuramate 1-kinase
MVEASWQTDLRILWRGWRLFVTGARMSDRAAAKLVFLQAAGWGEARRQFLAGDASDRSYERLFRGAARAVLMDAPPGKGDDPADFIAVADHLLRIGLSAPRLLAKDLAHGFLLLEDFGDAVFARLIDSDSSQERLLYGVAADALIALQAEPPLVGIADLGARDWAQAAAFALDWYRFAAIGQRVDTAPFVRCLGDLIGRYGDGPRVMVLRDYHAENLVWLPDRVDAARAGLLDFQLAQMGQPVYDLVSLLQDARRDVGVATVAQVKQQFRDACGQSEQAFSLAYAVWGAQRALRILGVFARLCLIADKPGYLRLMPRVWGHLQHNLAHPALRPLAQICDDLLPAPSAGVLASIAAQAGRGG